MPIYRTRPCVEEESHQAARRVSRAISDALNALKCELAWAAEVATNPARDSAERAFQRERCSRLSADVEALDALREQCEFRLSSIAGRYAAR